MPIDPGAGRRSSKHLSHSPLIIGLTYLEYDQLSEPRRYTHHKPVSDAEGWPVICRSVPCS